MRLLHTSDWHIGRRFNDQDLLPDQAKFGDWLVSLVREEDIDAVLISGDIFDRANPTGDAVSVAGIILERIVDSGADVVMISGNHDSAERLGFVSSLTAKGGLHIVTEKRSLLDIEGHVRLTGRNDDSIDILAIPFLEPSRITDPAGAQLTHEAVVSRTLEILKDRVDDPSSTIVMAHAFVTNGAVVTSESERTLAVGGIDTIPTSVFDGFGYVALGHLHRPQTVGSESIAYSGSPLAYSFSEEHEKSVRLVSTDVGIQTSIIPITTGRPVRTLEDSLDRLLHSTKYIDAEGSWVRAKLTDESLQLGAMDRLRTRFPWLLRLDQSTALTVQVGPTLRTVTGEARPPQDIVNDYVSDTFGDELSMSISEFIQESVNSAFSEEAFQ
jgi:exonuclease SbcD